MTKSCINKYIHLIGCEVKLNGTANNENCEINCNTEKKQKIWFEAYLTDHMP